MSEPQTHGASSETKAGSRQPQPKIHRVCIQCNNMFVVPFDRYDAKQCPNCHKG